MAGSTMRAVVLEGSRPAAGLVVRTVERPVPTGDLVLVRVRAASVNAADWHLVRAARLMKAVARLTQTTFQPIRGTDLAGVVEAVGPDVTRFKPGDEVFGGGRGSFAEYALSRERSLVLKPAGLSFEEAAAMPTAGLTALQGLRDVGRVEPGRSVLVHGAGGGVGTFSVQVAAALGGVVTAVTSTRNLEIVGSLGAAEVIDYTKVDVTRQDRRYDVVFDVAASRPLLAMARLVAPGGTYVLAGAAKGGWAAIGARLLGVTVLSRLGRQPVRTFTARFATEDLDALARLAEAGKVRPAIDATLPLEWGPEAIVYVGTGRARAKVVISV